MDPAQLAINAIHEIEVELARPPPSIPKVCTIVGCNYRGAKYRCTVCFPYKFVCLSCARCHHLHNPFHWIEVASGNKIRVVSLKSLGMRIQLGHSVADTCPLPIAADANFRICNAHGVHEASVDYCGCNGAPSHAQQLLSHRFYPNRDVSPTYAVAFELAYGFGPNGFGPISS
ncbi:hypothetical protein B0H17DRAFT_1218519 [Mycena rosella]|uniref:CxC2-like cysteine cluster KDZ transposase-associated domain-containing protein n=1 Tax=Mycena rosella TaxID=1033263 RepID=A0AAD7FLC9_MYCRO|nr:hypothetical protein B0H17DRAFT_1218519 [Mycena rosella]